MVAMVVLVISFLLRSHPLLEMLLLLLFQVVVDLEVLPTVLTVEMAVLEDLEVEAELEAMLVGWVAQAHLGVEVLQLLMGIKPMGVVVLVLVVRSL